MAQLTAFSVIQPLPSSRSCDYLCGQPDQLLTSLIPRPYLPLSMSHRLGLVLHSRNWKFQLAIFWHSLLPHTPLPTHFFNFRIIWYPEPQLFQSPQACLDLSLFSTSLGYLPHWIITNAILTWSPNALASSLQLWRAYHITAFSIPIPHTNVPLSTSPWQCQQIPTSHLREARGQERG